MAGRGRQQRVLALARAGREWSSKALRQAPPAKGTGLGSQDSGDRALSALGDAPTPASPGSRSPAVRLERESQVKSYASEGQL